MDNCPAATAAGSKSSNILLQKGRRRKKYTIVLRESSKRSVYKYFEFFLIGWVYVLAKKTWLDLNLKTGWLTGSNQEAYT